MKKGIVQHQEGGSDRWTWKRGVIDGSRERMQREEREREK